MRCVGEEVRKSIEIRVKFGGEEGSVCEVLLDGTRLEHISEFKYSGCVLDESGTDGAECRRKVASGRKVAGVIRSLVNARVLELECEGCCMRGCSCFFYCMIVRQCYGEKRRGLGLGLNRLTNSEVCWVLGGKGGPQRR